MSLLRHHQLLMSSSQSGSGSWNSTVANLPGLWAWWKLDELAGAVTAADSSGNGRDGTYTGTGFRTTPGIFSGSEAYRSSLGGRINTPTFPISASPQFSIVAWIIPNNVNYIQNIVSADGNPRVWQFRLNASKQVEFITFTGVGGSAPHVLSSGSARPTPGEPAMVAATSDHSGAVRNAIYINGAQAAATPSGTLYTPTAPAPMAIGAKNNTSSADSWGGGMDEVIITTTALSAGQILTLWNARNG